MTQRKLVFLDIDGTLTSAPNHVPHSAVAACRSFLAMHITKILEAVEKQ
jgi:hydroxymethylpyrimidine pyrophosphatase-like HAD family hydrolase